MVKRKKIKVGVGGHFTSFFFYLLHLITSSYVMDFIVELQWVTHTHSQQTDRFWNTNRIRPFPISF